MIIFKFGEIFSLYLDWRVKNYPSLAVYSVWMIKEWVGIGEKNFLDYWLLPQDILRTYNESIFPPILLWEHNWCWVNLCTSYQRHSWIFFFSSLTVQLWVSGWWLMNESKIYVSTEATQLNLCVGEGSGYW